MTICFLCIVTVIPLNIIYRGDTMFKLWVKIIKENRLIKDTIIEDATEDTRTHKIFNGLEEACKEFDLAKPIWLDSTIADFKRLNKARFTKDNFIEPIDFDYLELLVLEEDFL